MTTAKNTTQRPPHHSFGKKLSGAGSESDGKTPAAEKRRYQSRTGTAKTFIGLPQGLPALVRAIELQKRAAQVGFDWSSLVPVLDKIEEELQEEIGDLLFACINLARHTGIMPEAALDNCSDKFERRFRYIECILSERGSSPAETGLAEMDMLWEEAKAKDREFN